MVLCKLSVSGRPTNLDDSRARAYCVCSMCGWGMFGHFLFSSSFSQVLYARLKNGRIMLYPLASVRLSVRPSVRL